MDLPSFSQIIGHGISYKLHRLNPPYFPPQWHDSPGECDWFPPTSLPSFIPTSDKQVCLPVCSFMGVPVLGATILHIGTQVRVVAYKHCHEQGKEVGRVIPMIEIELLGPPHSQGMISFSETWSSIANAGGLVGTRHIQNQIQLEQKQNFYNRVRQKKHKTLANNKGETESMK